uniref:Pentacotripeptide-repeat region of PRORP domain-containing protein n=1 Tax=Phaeomonas parva TaxID=124430 RepID=A0A7S1UGN8_9STRA
MKIIKPRSQVGATILPAHMRQRREEEIGRSIAATPKEQLRELYESLLRGCAASGRTKEAEVAFAQMRKLFGDESADAQQYTTLLKTYVSKGDTRGATDVLKRMSADGVQPNSYTLQAIVRGCGVTGQMDAIPQWLKLFDQSGIEFSDAVHATVVSAYINGTRWDSAVAALNTMVDLGHRPQGPLCTRLVSHLYDAGGAEDALWVLKKGVKEGWWGSGIPPLSIRAPSDRVDGRFHLGRDGVLGRQIVFNIARQSQDVWANLWALIAMYDFAGPARDRIMLPPRPPVRRGNEGREQGGRSERVEDWPQWQVVQAKLKVFNGRGKAMNPPQGRCLWMYTRRRGIQEELSPWQEEGLHNTVMATLAETIEEEEIPLEILTFWEGSYGGVVLLPKRVRAPRSQEDGDEDAPRGSLFDDDEDEDDDDVGYGGALVGYGGALDEEDEDGF